MAVEVAKVEIKTVNDASGLAECIEAEQMKADNVVAVIGKTEGNGGINDFTRILADEAFRGVLMEHGTRSKDQVKQIPMVWSGGCDGVITPHATVFARDERTGPPDESRLSIGVALSPRILPEDIGRLAPPTADAGDNALLTCDISVVQLQGSGSNGNNLTFEWFDDNNICWNGGECGC